LSIKDEAYLGDRGPGLMLELHIVHSTDCCALEWDFSVILAAFTIKYSPHSLNSLFALKDVISFFFCIKLKIHAVYILQPSENTYVQLQIIFYIINKR